MEASELKNLIEKNLKDSVALVFSDDGIHFEARVICPTFTGMSKIKQHKLVYDALGTHFQQGTVHALSLKTYTPDAYEVINRG